MHQGFPDLPTARDQDWSNLSGGDINAWNEAWRQSPLYDRIVRRMGLDPRAAGGIHLTEAQRLELQGELQQASGGQFSGHDVHLDRAGNMHGNSSLIKRILIGAGIGGAALTGLGAFGIGPLAGLGGAGAAGAAGAAGRGAGLGGTLARIAGIAGTVAPLVGRLTRGGGGDGGGANPYGAAPGGPGGGVPPELQQLLGEAMSRISAQRPLFEATNRQALAGLPAYAQQGASSPASAQLPADALRAAANAVVANGGYGLAGSGAAEAPPVFGWPTGPRP